MTHCHAFTMAMWSDIEKRTGELLSRRHDDPCGQQHKHPVFSQHEKMLGVGHGLSSHVPHGTPECFRKVVVYETRGLIGLTALNVPDKHRRSRGMPIKHRHGARARRNSAIHTATAAPAIDHSAHYNSAC